jgi:hypothetical protein
MSNILDQSDEGHASDIERIAALEADNARLRDVIYGFLADNARLTAGLERILDGAKLTFDPPVTRDHIEGVSAGIQWAQSIARQALKEAP